MEKNKILTKRKNMPLTNPRTFQVYSELHKQYRIKASVFLRLFKAKFPLKLLQNVDSDCKTEFKRDLKRT